MWLYTTAIHVPKTPESPQSITRRAENRVLPYSTEYYINFNQRPGSHTLAKQYTYIKQEKTLLPLERISSHLSSQLRLNNTFNRWHRPPDLHDPQPCCRNQLPPLLLRPLRRRQPRHHNHIRRRHLGKRRPLADQALVDQQPRIPPLHGAGNILQNVHRSSVGPVVQHVM